MQFATMLEIADKMTFAGTVFQFPGDFGLGASGREVRQQPYKEGARGGKNKPLPYSLPLCVIDNPHNLHF
jgi:hypothetical protein